MKKWYAITGILALLLVISVSTCSSNSAMGNRVKRVVSEVRAELAAAETELADARAELGRLQEDYEELQQKYTVLQATK